MVEVGCGELPSGSCDPLASAVKGRERVDAPQNPGSNPLSRRVRKEGVLKGVQAL